MPYIFLVSYEQQIWDLFVQILISLLDPKIQFYREIIQVSENWMSEDGYWLDILAISCDSFRLLKNSVKLITKKTLEEFIKCRLDFEFEAVVFFNLSKFSAFSFIGIYMCNLPKHSQNVCVDSQRFQ